MHLDSDFFVNPGTHDRWNPRVRKIKHRSFRTLKGNQLSQDLNLGGLAVLSRHTGAFLLSKVLADDIHGWWPKHGHMWRFVGIENTDKATPSLRRHLLPTSCHRRL